ncbi:disease resistance protein RPM1 [Vigna unguiculata]|uniref:Disease resistance protein RPM1 n=1 Tax=Vigna unguiculata TaxID=3917 RepID=A0A4D6KL24_VIGUN|nr:disease resistance protein RPM1 [Vigna unguiculata]
MAETALSLARQHVFPKLLEAVNMMRDLPKEIAELKDELESFQYFINETDEVVEAEEDSNRRDRMSKRLMKLREATFRMEDVIDEYVLIEENQPQEDPRCVALLCEAVEFIKTQISRLQIAHKIRDVKSLASAARDGFETHFPLDPRPSNSRGNENVNWDKLRMDPLFVKEDEVVGLDGPRTILTNWLREGRNGRTVISVIGIPGVGKTTLAKQVFDKVHNDFECHALITVSQSYSVEELLRDMIQKLCKERKEDPPQNVSKMGRSSLIEEVRDRLHEKRYVVLFDDVWNEKFWDEIESALIDDNNKSRIIITTRYEKVAVVCKKSSFIEVHKLEEPLSEDESFRLFCRKAFMYGSSGGCPEELKDISLEIVRKCKGLPLAIVAIGGVLSQKDESPHEWKLFNQNLSLELERNSELNNITKILGLSYHDLPMHLRSCLLYFGMYPEDCEIESDRVIRQWMAEGFVRHEIGKTLEEVAEEDLLGLIRRNLVQVSSSSIDGKVKRCRVHDLIHEMILRKAKDRGFCGYIGRNEECVSSGIVRRLIITAEDDLIARVESTPIQSILFIEERRTTLTEEDFVRKIISSSVWTEDMMCIRDRVAVVCKKSSCIEVHKLEEPLSEDESFRLFCRKAFMYGLIRRNLVQVSSSSIDGKVKRCRVHDLIHEMILRKAKDSGFCGYIGRNDECVSSGIVRRLIITAEDDLIASVESSLIQSILFIEERRTTLTEEDFVRKIISSSVWTEDMVRKILANYRSLKVLDFEGAYISCVPENFEHLIHLRYLSLRRTGAMSLPSIGKLHNLETLDIRDTNVRYIPTGVYNLRKLRHFLADEVTEIEWMYIGRLKSLQKIPIVSTTDLGEAIREVGKLKQLRVLRVKHIGKDDEKTLCSAINEMQQLEALHIEAADYYISDVIDLNITSPLSRLRKLFLDIKLKGLPNWIPQLQNLVKLNLRRTVLTNDELQSLKDMPRLLILHLCFGFKGETLHFQCGGFQRLKKMHLDYLLNLNSILIDSGALHSLEYLWLKRLRKLKTVPVGIQHLKNLKLVQITSMPTEFELSILPIAEQQQWILQ